MPTLLIVDDEPSVCYGFRRAFGESGVTVLGARSLSEGLSLFEQEQPSVVVLDLQLPDGSGLDLFEVIHARNPNVPVVFITAHGTTQTALTAMKNGAFDYLMKPVDLTRLGSILNRAFEAARSLPLPPVPAPDPFDRIIGCSRVMQEMCKVIGRVAPQDVNVLILGESGTGKELVARTLHENSRRAEGAFVALNCAALPEGLAESELFGHEQGAFTGADRRRVGKFEHANGGTLFLDEIGDMPQHLQAKMLRLLQEQQFERVGGNRTLQANVRIIAATNQDLESLIAQGRFRRDLYYRLRVVTLQVPPLRQRDGDVMELAFHFLQLYNAEMQTTFHGFGPAALERLRTHDWPGNVRELQGAIKEAMLRGSGHLLLREFLPDYLQDRANLLTLHPEPDDLDVGALVDRLVEEKRGEVHAEVVRAVERAVILRVLRHTQGHQAQASEILGITRTTLRNKVRELGIAIDRVVNAEGNGAVG